MKGSVFVSFLAGASIGGAITWYVTRHHYNKLRDQEAESFVAKLRELKKEESAPAREVKEETPEEKKKRNDELVDSLLEGAKKIAESHSYKNYSDADAKKDDEEGDSDKKSEDFKKKTEIEIITRDQWDNDDEYNKCGINVYTGGFEMVFTDDADQKMSDGYLSETIGIDIRDQIVDSEETDDMYVRNHKNKTDYEIIFDLQSYEQAHKMTE